MTLDFVKMNGAGNDFILIDNRSGRIRLNSEQVVRLCHRQRGIGADGLFLLVPNHSGKAEWSWEFFNSDGSAADMCGNGARCFARFVQRVAGAVVDEDEVVSRAVHFDEVQGHQTKLAKAQRSVKRKT